MQSPINGVNLNMNVNMNPNEIGLVSSKSYAK